MTRYTNQMSVHVISEAEPQFILQRPCSELYP